MLMGAQRKKKGCNRAQGNIEEGEKRCSPLRGAQGEHKRGVINIRGGIRTKDGEGVQVDS